MLKLFKKNEKENFFNSDEFKYIYNIRLDIIHSYTNRDKIIASIKKKQEILSLLPKESNKKDLVLEQIEEQKKQLEKEIDNTILLIKKYNQQYELLKDKLGEPWHSIVEKNFIELLENSL